MKTNPGFYQTRTTTKGNIEEFQLDLSIIIVNWNTREMLRECLRSIVSSQPSINFEVIVIDNASSDDSVAMVKNEFPFVHLICNNQNVGFAKANNQGIACSSGNYVLLLNSDTEIFPMALEELVCFMNANPQAGGAGSLLLNPDGSLQVSCFPFPTISGELWRLFHLDRIYVHGVYAMEKWNREDNKEVDYLQGASLVLRKEALDQVGTLDEDYFMYSEELDLCYRMTRAGWKMFWTPRSKITHYGGQSTKQVAEKMFLELYRSKILFFRKNHPENLLQYKISLIAASIIRIILSPFFLLETKTLREKHFMMTRYYRRLIMEIPKM
jgi:GT2 family glycosyltransferase